MGLFALFAHAVCVFKGPVVVVNIAINGGLNKEEEPCLKITFFTSESVTEGHPDKIADQISDSILDAMLEQDPLSRVACETMITTGQVVFGRRSDLQGPGGFAKNCSGKD